MLHFLQKLFNILDIPAVQQFLVADLLFGSLSEGLLEEPLLADPADEFQGSVDELAALLASLSGFLLLGEAFGEVRAKP